MSDQREAGLFSLPENVINVVPNRRVNQLIGTLLEKTFGLSHLQSFYQALPPARDDVEFLQQVFDAFNIAYQIEDAALARIPRTGPLVVVANHPFGAIEGVILAALLRGMRSDVKIMANFILSRIPEVSDLFISVNPYASSDATKANVPPLRQAIRWVKDGGLLVVFPAGEVSYWSPRTRQISDPPWSKTVSRLIHCANADVLPVYFHGANSLLFQVAGLMHPRVRTALLPRELMNKANTEIEIQVGRHIPYSKLKSFDDQDLIDHLRFRTYLLRNAASVPVTTNDAKTDGQNSQGIAPVIEAMDPDALCKELSLLDDSHCLVESGDMRVYTAEATEVPLILREIGRLRELTFRAVGEGTGQPLDLDHYDDYYLHLFIWNSAKHEVVGAYRLGQGDLIMDRFGKKGFYSHSLFKYKTRLLDKLNPALEMGRSFVRLEYQRSFSPLMLLWRGISQYVYRNPQYRRLFGPVSISSEYRALSQQLIVEFLKDNADFPDYSCHVKPRKPFRGGFRHEKRASRGFGDLDLFSDLVSSIEPDAKGVPVLLRQYLKLGGRILGFNVDPKFSNVLDGLIMVDLLETDPRVLAKYMGREKAREFRQFHEADGPGLLANKG